MPILSFTMRSQDIDNPADHTSQTAIQTINLKQSFKMKYLKLLHLYTNISYTEIHDGDEISQAENTILFARISFLNSKQSQYFEVVNGEIIEHSGMVCLGESVADPHKTTFRDAYKVLHSKGTLYINQPFTIQLFQLRSLDPGATNSSVATYNAVKSHTIVPLSCSEFRGALNGAGQFVSFVFEYDDDETK